MPCLIIANGPIPPPEFMRSLAKFANFIVCADGGANHAQVLGIVPDLIIGDFDSITASAKEFFRQVAQINLADQNSTDLEKALKYCVEQGIKTADIVGTLGDRIDHSTSSLGCFKKFGDKIYIRMIESAGELTLIPREVNLNMQIGEKLSLIPVDRCTGVTTKNLKYKLEDSILELGIQEGISNEATSTDVTVRLESGTLLLYRFRLLVSRSDK